MENATIIESFFTISGVNICCIEYGLGELKAGYKLISSNGYEWEILNTTIVNLKKENIPGSLLTKLGSGVARFYKVKPIGHEDKIPSGQVVSVVLVDK